MAWLSAQWDTWEIQPEHVPVCKEENSERKTEGFFCIVKVLVPFAPVLSGVTLNVITGNDSRSELREVLTKKMTERGQEFL